MTRSLLATLACLALLLVTPALSVASGGETIGDAPPLNLGTVETGGAHFIDFWRVQLYQGDVITFDADLSNYDAGTIFDLFAPSVNEYTLSHTQAAAATGRLPAEKQQFTLTSPFTGMGTLSVCQTESPDCTVGGFKENPYTFTASVTHAVSLAVSAPILARPRSRVTVSAVVQSPAGSPQGACLIQGIEAPLTGGHCARRVRLGRTGRQTVRVSFVPDDGWQEASGARHIRLAR
jgi:hypothetical protein